MQDRYTADVGDFGKFGLLRVLARGLKLGVVWHLVPDEGHNDDGKHVGYLAQPRRFRSCDPPLFESMGLLAGTDRRSIRAMQVSGVLPADTAYVDLPLSFASCPRGERVAMRAAWVESALALTSGCDLVFFDPDNGLDVPTRGRHTKLGPKHAFVDELVPYWARGQSLIVYHHIGRRGGTAAEQARTCLRRLVAVAPGADAFALLFRRGSCRAYLIVARGPELRRRATAMLAGPWSAHFDMPIEAS